MSSLTSRIRTKASEIGIDKIGIVPAEAMSIEKDRLEQWLAKGFHGEMAWMAREPEKRTDPKGLFPDAVSVIVCAVNYYTPHFHDDSQEKGKISRYAWGDDYHDVVRGKLILLLDWLRSEVPEAEGKVCVDTAPIMDKAWAARAGLGWIGKHSNLITKELGSWVFIGELLVNIPLEYDTKTVDDHCGSCTACIDACPTDAIIEPYVVDSRNCISYATIELRSDNLPDNIAQNLEGWFYGCDICQDVCPWNRFEKPTENADFHPRNGATSVDLDEVLNLTPSAYAERFRKSAIKRAKLAGLKRNAKALNAKDNS